MAILYKTQTNQPKDIMQIELIKDNKLRFLDLLLLGDQQENRVNKYLDYDDLFALYDNDLKSVC
ncbi:MAG: hypothetical protein GX638_07650 [Crenarchaeota archaeon]|jgi:hypothetical protein|nr:hypothetical protein [Thermoproteota archaeon]